jgi:hypothetical protein
MFYSIATNFLKQGLLQYMILINLIELFAIVMELTGSSQSSQ